jgi:2-oxo-4-hydroxy-4-carboxy--5-ureidoimidazoline (OHCU) decarboxylase
VIVAGESHYKENDLNQEKFVSKFGTLHEHSPWIAEEACGRIAVATAASASAWCWAWSASSVR